MLVRSLATGGAIILALSGLGVGTAAADSIPSDGPSLTLEERQGLVEKSKTNNREAVSQSGEVAPMSANGCTAAPGPTGAGTHNCVVVNGSGHHIDSAYSQYYYTQPVGPAVCDRHHQFMFTDIWGNVVIRDVNPGGCINSGAMVVTGDSVSLPDAPFYVQGHTGFCTRVLNNRTGGSWSPWACVDILP